MGTAASSPSIPSARAAASPPNTRTTGRPVSIPRDRPRTRYTTAAISPAAAAPRETLNTTAATSGGTAAEPSTRRAGWSRTELARCAHSTTPSAAMSPVAFQ